MKRIALTLSAFVLMAFPIFSQDTIVSIPDTAFLHALIEEGVDTNEDGKISYDEAKVATSLKFDDPSIKDITGIEAFINLLTLDCGFIQMSSLDVSMNTALTTLICPQNDLNSLDVSACTALKYLTCWGNQFSSLDVSACDSLTELDCRWSQLTSLNVSGHTALKKIICNGGQLTSLDASGCTALTVLGCNDNQLTALDVSGCTSLLHLACWGNQLSSLDVSGNNTLRDLRCFSNQLTNLDASGCTALTVLGCNENQLTSLDVSGCKALKDLNCYDNQLISLDVSGCTALKNMDCSHNDLISLDLSTNKKIAQGYTVSPWGGFNVYLLDLREMPTLHEICVWQTFFSDSVNYNLKGSPNVYFTTDCQYVDKVFIPDTSFLYALIEEGVDTNEDGLISYEEAEVVTSLEVGGNYDLRGNIADMKGLEAFINLEHLDCRYNQLSSLDAANNIELFSLQCGMNYLTSLDVSGCIDLVILDCGCGGIQICQNVENANLITTLDVSNNQSLTDIDLSYMPTLKEVCVWESFNPDVLSFFYIYKSPNVYFTIDCTIGFEERKCDNISIYPNPTNQVLNIEAESLDHYYIELNSLNGQLIYSSEMEGTSHQIDLYSFQKGVYIIFIRSEDLVTTRKIIKL